MDLQFFVISNHAQNKTMKTILGFAIKQDGKSGKQRNNSNKTSLKNQKQTPKHSITMLEAKPNAVLEYLI